VEMWCLVCSGREIAGCLFDPVSEVGAGGQAVRVLLAEDQFAALVQQGPGGRG
jgi:hypothetical protein